jgi:hypothetical protein
MKNIIQHKNETFIGYEVEMSSHVRERNIIFESDIKRLTLYRKIVGSMALSINKKMC